MSGFEQDVAVGVAQLLNDELATAPFDATWNPAGAYSSAALGIFYRVVPQDAGRLITLSTYTVDDHPSLSDSVVALQVRTRWDTPDPRLVDDLDDVIFNALHGRHGFDLATGVRVVQCLRRSSASLGQDEAQRWSRSSNYYLDVHRPSTYRT